MIGDVSGKGLGAALVMSSFLSAARVLYTVCSNVAELATRLSRALHYDIAPAALRDRRGRMSRPRSPAGSST
jgi:hypothetical protein